ncbi:DUF7319 domain-containing protein [Haloquadratum walsbyi]|uniref:DUF7319 domain-containing protein n=1 Tax=Haloquadratum walsbyi (strain DSM 16854 / JCM 12705 / C23) TaxID=768065 RepID=G0LGN7_HALWC|nr:hypothetical protein [Haloquadratum walsbyi]CCC39589.1 uncharacterized protein Hqrw_1648 [Haloquadratum walsbyi C23]
MTESSNDETAISDDTDAVAAEDADDSSPDQIDTAQQRTHEDGDSSQGRDGSANEHPNEDEQAIAELRAEVEETYDFGDFGPEDMAEMTLEEWEAAFDPDTWIVGEELLDRVETELKARVAIREVFGIVERTEEGGQDRVVAYSDNGYATVFADGSVEGEGTIRRDVEPTVALCSMDSYETMNPPADASLPEPRDVVKGSGEFGNLMLQIVAAAQMIVGVGLLGAWLFISTLETIAAPVTAVIFVLIGFFLFIVVANARLSDRFRVEEYRNRLQALETTPEPEVASNGRTALNTEEAKSNIDTNNDDTNTSMSSDTATADANIGVNPNANSHTDSEEHTDSI